MPLDKCMLLSLKLNPTITKPTVSDSKASPETAILSADALELMDAAYCSEMRRVATGIYEEIGEGSSLGKGDTGGVIVNGRLASLLSLSDRGSGRQRLIHHRTWSSHCCISTWGKAKGDLNFKDD